jgi:hypothetical protein
MSNDSSNQPTPSADRQFSVYCDVMHNFDVLNCCEQTKSLIQNGCHSKSRIERDKQARVEQSTWT